MIGAGPQLSYETAGGGTKVAVEIALECMIWPTADRKFGWFIEPTCSYSLRRGHEQSVGITTGLLIAIPANQVTAKSNWHAGWVERSETHPLLSGKVMGFARAQVILRATGLPPLMQKMKEAANCGGLVQDHTTLDR